MSNFYSSMRTFLGLERTSKKSGEERQAEEDVGDDCGDSSNEDNVNDEHQESGPKCGGFTDEQDATPEVSDLVESLHEDIEGKTGETYEALKVVRFRSQVVAGMNYRVKVCVGGDSFIHILVFKPLPCMGKAPQLMSVEMGKSLEDPL